jgi:hypothetical protein
MFFCLSVSQTLGAVSMRNILGSVKSRQDLFAELEPGITTKRVRAVSGSRRGA